MLGSWLVDLMDVLDCEAYEAGILDDGQKCAEWNVTSCIELLPRM
jgi:hypothetical protein